MTDDVVPHKCSPSHTQTPKNRKITRRPPGQESQSPQASLLPWNLKKPVTMTLKYRGGPEGWVEIRARGRTWRRPGVTAIHDVLLEALGHPGWWSSRH